MLKGIQSARGIAALMVVAYHAERTFALPQYLSVFTLDGVTGFGHAGVDFFFILSGFIIYLVHHGDIGQPSALPRYLLKRITRIYPPYWAVTLLIIAISLRVHDLPSGSEIVHSLLLLPGNPPPILGVAWTLVSEVRFYLLFAIAIISLRWAFVVAALVVGIGILPLPAWTDDLQAWGASRYDTQFVAGVGVAWLTLHRSLRYPGVVAIFAAATFIAVGLAENAGLFSGDSVTARLAFGVPAGLLIWGLAQTEQSGLLRVPPALVMLGAASYSIYLVHSPVLGYAARGLAAIGVLGIVPGWAGLGIGAGIAVGAGIAFHHAVERPLTAFFSARRSKALTKLT